MIHKLKIKGKVIKGNGYGKKIGFPTANVDRREFLKIKTKPKFGIYRGKATLGKSTYRAGIIIGPLDRRGLPKIEAHLIGFSGNIYGRIVILEIGTFIRKFKKFKTEEELIVRIGKDIKKC